MTFSSILNTPSTPNPARKDRAEADRATLRPLRVAPEVPLAEGPRNSPIQAPVITPSINWTWLIRRSRGESRLKRTDPQDEAAVGDVPRDQTGGDEADNHQEEETIDPNTSRE